MSFDPCRTPHPSVPNVADLTGENAALKAAVDKLVIELARCRGVSEDVIRVRRGLPPGNPWAARRRNTPAGVTGTGLGRSGTIAGYIGVGYATTGPQIEDYAI